MSGSYRTSLWREQRSAWPTPTTAISTAYVFFKHEDAASGPFMAVRFLELAPELEVP